MAFTKLSRNFLISLSCLIFYTSIGGFSHPIISFFIFGVISLLLTFLLTAPKNEDMDMLTALCIHSRGVKCPRNATPMTMTQNCCIYFEDKLDFENHLKPMLIDKFYKYKRLTHTGTLKSSSSPLWNTKWTPIEINERVYDRMIKKHIVSDNNELYALIDDLCNQHLPKDLPLWIFHYIENNNGLSLWLWRVSHGIADGIRLIPIAADLLQDINGKPIGSPQNPILKRTKNRKQCGMKTNWFNPMTYYHLIADIYQIWYTINGRCDTICAFKPDDKIHGPKTQIHVRNKVPFKISDIKLLKTKFNVSFNDIITCLTCSGIRAYILSQDADFFNKNKNISMTSMLAFGFPPKEEFLGQTDWLKNGFSMNSWAFPIQIADFEQRLIVINKNGEKLKKSFVAPLGLFLTEFAARLGLDGLLETNFTRMFQRHTCVFSSLPSWDKQLYFGGVKVNKLEGSYFNWIPQFIFISYNEEIYGTLIVDINTFPNAQIIMDGMNEELVHLLKD